MKTRCAICGCGSLRNRPLFKFTQLLRELNKPGQLAHPRCVSLEQDKRKLYRSKFGEDARVVQM